MTPSMQYEAVAIGTRDQRGKIVRVRTTLILNDDVHFIVEG